MSILSLIEGLFSRAETKAETVTAAFSTTNAFVGVVLGEAEAVAGVVAEVDPAVGGPIQAAIAELQALRGGVRAAVDGAEGNAAAAAAQVGQLSAKATELAVQIAPFFKAVANDVGTAAEAVKSQASTAAAA